MGDSAEEEVVVPSRLEHFVAHAKGGDLVSWRMLTASLRMAARFSDP